MRLRAASVLCLGALVTACIGSCASVIGADEELSDAIDLLCKCLQSNSDLVSAIGPPAACKSELSRRLDSARSEVREAWLKNYADVCAGRCGTESQPDLWLNCFYVAPTCSKNNCSNTSECCGALGGTETCEGNICSAAGGI